MSDESLDDVHAFTNLRNVVKQIKIPVSNTAEASANGTTNSYGTAGVGALTGDSNSNSNASREGSVAGSLLGDSTFLLETLEEFDDENDELDDDENDYNTTSTSPPNNNNDLKDKMNAMTIQEEH